MEKTFEELFTKELNEAVQSVRRNERWRLDYMTLYMKYQEKYEEGYDKGVECGIERGIEQGDRKRALEVAKKMIEKGKLLPEEISMYSGLSLEQVFKLKDDLLKDRKKNG